MGMPNKSKRMLLKSGLALGLSNLVSIQEILAKNDPFFMMDATAQADLIKKGEVSAEEMVMSAINRIEAVDGYLNAVVTRSFEKALLAAKNHNGKGPFPGVPYLIKDLLNHKGVRATGGSRMFANRIAKRNSSNVQAAFDMGLISLGKTNTPEFGLLGVTESLLLGPARNPWNFERSPGGSSGGSAAAVASGMVSIASASDGGGSIRVPASCCGIVGLKPTIHRTIDDAQPNRPIDLSVRFVHTRSIRDTITALHHMQARNNSKLKAVPKRIVSKGKKFKIAMITTNMLGEEADPEVKNAIESSTLICQDLGHRVEAINPFIDGNRFSDSFLTMWAFGAKGIVDLAQQNFVSNEISIDSLLEPWTLGLGKWFDSQPEGKVELALSRLRDDTLKTQELFKSFDFILSPVTQSVAPKIGSMAPDVSFDTLLERSLDFITFTPLANVTGDPAISLPMHWSSSGLPIGTHLHASYGNEEELLELALELEAAKPWSQRWPTI